MNIYSKLLLGAAALSFAACSNTEEPIGNPAEEPAQEVLKPTGDIAYLTVNIKSAESGRAGDYIYGETDENSVRNAYFYFYDNDGNFVLESNTWLGSSDGTEENVEILGENTVVLTGLTGKNYPNWVVTVLNRPDDFTPGETLDEMGKILVDAYALEATETSTKDFIMTTSSYYGADNKQDGTDIYRYFATKLDPKNFTDESPNYDDKPTVVNIYVERLAARVGVRVNLNNKVLQGVTYNGHKLYELDLTVAGNENPNLGEGSTTAASKVYVAILGWALNSTAKSSNLMKDISKWSINEKIGNWEWNNSDYHRSFWGKSFTYGKAEAELEEAMISNDYAWDELTHLPNGEDRVYCFETTNEVANILKDGQVSPKYTPTVLLSAVVCDETGKALELVKYQGIEYTKTGFIKRVLSLVNFSDKTKNFYIREQRPDAPAGVYNYRQIDVDDVMLVSAGNGLGSVTLKVADEDITYYTNLRKTEVTIGDTKYTMDEGDEASIEVVNTHLGKTITSTNKAIAKTDGAMFYSIPLTHLNRGAADEIVEGQYGLVRNHTYELTVSKIKSLGDGVFKPYSEGGDSEPINPEDPKDPTFYVTSSVNILAWKVVNQSVEI